MFSQQFVNIWQTSRFSNWSKPNLHQYIKEGDSNAIFCLFCLNYLSDERDLCVTPPPSSLVSSTDPLSHVTYGGGDQTLLYFNPEHCAPTCCAHTNTECTQPVTADNRVTRVCIVGCVYLEACWVTYCIPIYIHRSCWGKGVDGSCRLPMTFKHCSHIICHK